MIKIKLAIITLIVIGTQTIFSQVVVTGTVTGEDNMPIPGVTVVIKGTLNGTTTNFDGEYVLQNVSEGNIIQYSYVGMISEERIFSGSGSINIVLKENVTD